MGNNPTPIMPPAGDFQPFQSTSSRVGTITQWQDDKGYGWVECGGERMFVHVKDFDRGQRRPAAGEEVRFLPGIDPQGRACAKRVVFVKPGKGLMGASARMLLGILLVLPLLAILRLPFPWWMGAGGMLVVSAITYAMYAHDKKRAVSNEWRVPENTLHLAEMLGGWPGAFLAQRRLRHKCSKPTYQAVFWLIVLLHQAAALDVMTDHRLSKAVVRLWL